MPHFLRMLIFVVIENVVLYSVNTGSQSKVWQICIHVLHISTMCQERHVWYLGIDFPQKYSCLHLHPHHFQGLPSILLCLLLFSQLAFLMHSSLGVRQSIPVLHSTLDTQPGFLSFLFLSDCLLYIFNRKCVLSFTLCCSELQAIWYFPFLLFFCRTWQTVYPTVCEERSEVVLHIS